MIIKKTIRSFLQLAKHLIPFYWLKNHSSKYNQLNSGHDAPDGVGDNYTTSDVNNEARGAIRLFSVLFFISIPLYIGAALLAQIIYPPLVAALAIVVGGGVIGGLVDQIAKQVIRSISWLRHRSNPEVINPTYPQKYNTNDSDASYDTMKKLYSMKQAIKSAPEGWTGLSDDQIARCAVINAAVSHVRKSSVKNSFFHSSSRSVQRILNEYNDNHLDQLPLVI